MELLAHHLKMEDSGGSLITFIHFLFWNILLNTTRILEGEKIIYPQGKNKLRKHGCVEPCPLFGIYPYFFKLQVIDKIVAFESEENKKKLKEEISKNILVEAQIIGTLKNINFIFV